jgi:hypothetical protein
MEYIFGRPLNPELRCITNFRSYVLGSIPCDIAYRWANRHNTERFYLYLYLYNGAHPFHLGVYHRYVTALF